MKTITVHEFGGITRSIEVEDDDPRVVEAPVTDAPKSKEEAPK